MTWLFKNLRQRVRSLLACSRYHQLAREAKLRRLYIKTPWLRKTVARGKRYTATDFTAFLGFTELSWFRSLLNLRCYTGQELLFCGCQPSAVDDGIVHRPNPAANTQLTCRMMTFYKLCYWWLWSLHWPGENHFAWRIRWVSLHHLRATSKSSYLPSPSWYKVNKLTQNCRTLTFDIQQPYMRQIL